MGLKKLWKKVRKATGLPALTLGTAAKLGAVVGTGGLGAGALALGTAALKSKLKSAAVGGIKQVIRTKADRVLHRKTAAAPVLARPTVVPISAQTMPGGAPLKGIRTPRPRKVKAKAPKVGKVVRVKAQKAPRKASGGGRKPPKGGKDLKALSASWNAAGKPGKWIDWVKSH